MLERLLNLSIIELLAFVATAGVMLSLVVLLPYKIIKEINRQKK
ncbi:MAG: hypothetical protein QM504_05230 [Pseudomonadota bacterium]